MAAVAGGRRIFDVDDPDAAIRELVEAGWWTETEDGWLIEMNMAEQRTPEQVERDRKANAERQLRWRAEQDGQDDRNAVSNATRNAVTPGTGLATGSPSSNHLLPGDDGDDR